MDDTTKSEYVRASMVARPREPSFSLILNEIFSEDFVPLALSPSQAIGSSAFTHLVNGHGPSTNATAPVDIPDFSEGGGGEFFPDNFCIGENGENLIYSLGPEQMQEENSISIDDFSMGSNESEFIVRLVNFEENTKAKYDVLETPPPSFDFTSIACKFMENNESWKSLQKKAENLVKSNRKKSIMTNAKNQLKEDQNVMVRSITPPTTHKRKLATNIAKSTMSKEVRRQEAAESHRRATAKRARINGRFAKRQYVWVNIGADGRKTTK